MKPWIRVAGLIAVVDFTVFRSLLAVWPDSGWVWAVFCLLNVPGIVLGPAVFMIVAVASMPFGGEGWDAVTPIVAVVSAAQGALLARLLSAAQRRRPASRQP